MSMLSIAQQKNYKNFLSLVLSYESLGRKDYTDGSSAIGRVPHVAPFAYLHRLFSPLSEDEVKALQVDLDFEFHASLKAFFALHNGVKLFVDYLTIDGKRRDWQRADFESAAQQPFSIQLSNRERDRLVHAKDSLLVGAIGPDCKPVTMDSTGNISIWENNKELSTTKHYTDIFQFLIEEAEAASILFDGKGHRISI